MTSPAAPKVFCSYRSSDLAVVDAFARRLRDRGLDAWLDRWEIAAGHDIVARMDEGVDGCDAALIFISHDWFDGNWARDEYTSLALRKVEDGIRFIPVVLDDVDTRLLPARLRKLARRSIEDFEGICDALLGVDRKPGLVGALRAAPIALTISVEQQPDAQIVTTMAVDEADPICVCTRAPVASLGLDGGDSAEALALLGSRVAQVLFPGEIAAAVQALLDRLGPANVVDLRIYASDDLIGLAFEAARLPDGRVPALLDAVRMTRSQLGLDAKVALPAPGPLKILVAVGAPDEGQTRGAQLDVEAEMGLIVDSVGPAAADDRAQVRILEVGDVESIRRALERDDYHALHLSGHGAADTIELSDEDGAAVSVSAGELIDAFQAAGRIVPLVFVSACSGGASAGGFALGLHRRGVARVVAMSGSVSDGYASDLAAAFYAQLSSSPSPRAGVALAAARREVQRARRRDGDRHPPEWATATLLLAGEDTAILDGDLDQVALRQPPVYAVGDAVPMLGMGELIGRRRELRTTMRALRGDKRFTSEHGEVAGVVLTGIGGIGKSSVAGRAMARLASDGWTVSATTGPWSLERVCRQLAGDLPADGPAWTRDLRARLESSADDAGRIQALRRALRDHRVLLVFDNFEDNLAEDASAFLDPPTADVLSDLAHACKTGRVLVTSRYPLPGCMDVMARVAIGPLTASETRRVFLRLDGLRQLHREDVLLVRALIGGHPRALELLDALLRHGVGVAGVRGKLRTLAAREGIETRDDRDVASAIQLTVRLAARDIILDALVGALDDVERETLLQVAVSALPVARDDLAAALHDVAAAEDVRRAAERLVSLSLIAEVEGELWVHRWTAEALRLGQAGDAHRARCLRAGNLRTARIRAHARDIAEGIEATQNFLDANALDAAAEVAVGVCDFLAGSSTVDLASFARRVREALPTSHDKYKIVADHEGQALLALGNTGAAVERYVEMVLDHKRLADREPDRAEYQRDLSVSYNKLGDLQRALGDGDQALKLYTSSLQIRERLAKAEPDRADYQRDLSVSYERLADLQSALGNGAQALKLYTSSLQIRERLAKAEPDRADYQRDLSVSYNRLAGCARDDGDLTAAHRYLSADLEIARRLLELQPQSAEAAVDVATSLAEIAGVETDPVASRAEAASILERLAAENRLDSRGQALLAALR